MHHVIGQLHGFSRRQALEKDGHQESASLLRRHVAQQQPLGGKEGSEAVRS